MKKVLVVTYSQSGETARIASLFAGELKGVGAEVTIEAIRPLPAYPYPWRSIRKFFDAMPESILGLPPRIEPPGFDPASRFDLIVIAYPVWFLSPAPPIRGFYASSYANVLKGTDVVTISVSRAMWQTASLTTRKLLAVAGARHCDNVVVTHRGSAILTLVSTPRAMLFGKQDALMGVFPEAGIAPEELPRLGGLARTLAGRFLASHPAGKSFLAGEPAVAVKRWLIVPEMLASYCFRGSARIIRALGNAGTIPRAVGAYGFALFLVFLIIVGLPLVLIGTALLAPFLGGWLARRAASLAEPTGEIPVGPEPEPGQPESRSVSRSE